MKNGLPFTKLHNVPVSKKGWVDFYPAFLSKLCYMFVCTVIYVYLSASQLSVQQNNL